MTRAETKSRQLNQLSHPGAALVSPLMVWFLWVQSKAKVTPVPAFCCQAHVSISQCSVGSEESWVAPPCGLGGGKGKGGGFWGSGAKFLSGLSLVWVSYLLSINTSLGWNTANGNKSQLLL